MSTVRGILQITPELGALTLLKSHKSTLESFGKKLEDKQKSWRSVDILMSAKPAAWEKLRDYSDEIIANSELVIILSEGLLEATMRAVSALLGASSPSPPGPRLQVISSSLGAESLASLAAKLRGQRVSLLLTFQGPPSPRLLWCFEHLYSQLASTRRIEETRRRVFVAADADWPAWAKGRQFRALSLPARCFRYLFFTEPVALLLMLLGLPAWQCVEGGRSFVRAFDKKAGLADPILAYAALREIQLSERARECVLLPDESFGDFARWWRLLSEDSRQAFTEEQGQSRVEIGAVLCERYADKGRVWSTEVAIDDERGYASENLSQERSLAWPSGCREWGAPEPNYQAALQSQRREEPYLQPSVRLALRRVDLMSVGALFAFFEGVVSASHKLADLDEKWEMLPPRVVFTSIESRL